MAKSSCTVATMGGHGSTAASRGGRLSSSATSASARGGAEVTGDGKADRGCGWGGREGGCAHAESMSRGGKKEEEEGRKKEEKKKKKKENDRKERK